MQLQLPPHLTTGALPRTRTISLYCLQALCPPLGKPAGIHATDSAADLKQQQQQARSALLHRVLLHKRDSVADLTTDHKRALPTLGEHVRPAPNVLVEFIACVLQPGGGVGDGLEGSIGGCLCCILGGGRWGGSLVPTGTLLPSSAKELILPAVWQLHLPSIARQAAAFSLCANLEGCN